jgi:hypothetical protein
MRTRVFEACCNVSSTTNCGSGGCSLDNIVDDDSNCHIEYLSDSNDQRHSGSVQVVDDDEAEELLSNYNNSHTRLQ